MEGEAKAPHAYYLRSNKLEAFQEGSAMLPGTTRVCAISDTHLVHDQMVLPHADVLVHSGDVMTESLLRHVKDGAAKAKGEELFVQFAGGELSLDAFDSFLTSFDSRMVLLAATPTQGADCRQSRRSNGGDGSKENPRE
jgi:hypothetical protein